MAWYSFLFPKASEPMEAMPNIPPIEKIEANIARFRRAIEQNDKGGQRHQELSNNLARWEKMRELSAMEV